MTMTNSQAFIAHVNGYIHARKSLEDGHGFEVLLHFADGTGSGELEEYQIDDNVQSWEITSCGPDLIHICIVQQAGGVVDEIRPLRLLTVATFYHPDRDAAPAPEGNHPTQVTA